MKTEITENGWKETTVKNFTITSFHKHNPDSTIAAWIESNEKIFRGRQKGMRCHCSCCKIRWEKIEGKINSVMTDKGNQVVCDDCFRKLIGRRENELNNNKRQAKRRSKCITIHGC